MTRTRYRIFETEYPYFLACTVVAWLPIFADPAMATIVFNSWRFLQQQRQVKIFGYVLMENHLHWIAAHEELSQRSASSSRLRHVRSSTRSRRQATKHCLSN